MTRTHIKKLGELLLDFNFITEKQLNEALKKQNKSGKKLGEILVESGYLNENDLIQVLEFQLGIPHADLNKYVINPHLAQYIPENIARRHNVVPLEKKNGKLKVAMVDPTNLVAIEDIEMTSGLKVEPLIASRKNIKMALNQIYSVNDSDAAEVFASLNEVTTKTNEEPELNELKEMIEDAPIVRLANLIINQAIQMKASDIHIEPQEDQVRVRYRVDGVLRENMTVPKHSQAALISRLKIIADLDITERRVPQDGRIELNVSGVKIDMRVSTLPTVYGEKVVIRLLNKEEKLLQIEQLGFSETNLSRFMKLIKQPHGIILVTGPTGSGKSTTLFAALNKLNTPEKNIITVEDPVEYQLRGINQVQANSRVGLTFASALRSILRQDPDIVMVGEIRDEETARIAVRAALTGHLVLSTLHTNDAVSSVTRLIDMGIPPYLVASSVIGVVAQRLVRRLCTCKEEYVPGPEEMEFLQVNDIGKLQRPEGCKKCHSTGYRGRLPVHEILIMDRKLREMIVNGEGESVIKKYARKAGMLTLKEDGVNKVIEGLTSYEELARVVS
ncbi:type II secretion system ATPase GspE [Halothermothrix orenii]|uniref:protein-secreting ATPase n=1 Tax=Halothermothrix orenii (strain H 168 / OCM 544 / DSM 9562) TaxID=373903 RepID=B8D2C7_HALOH|nr:type II secretion system ATPase GspE [Halothermothrix orenii]ACL69354.1 Tfp pilus assembly protein PilB [Halothermothrix orenii H 168]